MLIKQDSSEVIPKVAIIANNASALFGGEAIIPLHYFRQLREKNYDAFLIVHERVKGELSELLPHEIDNIYYIKDSFLQKFFWKIGSYLPKRVATVTFGVLIGLLTEFQQRTIAKRLIKSNKVNIIHQPTPVSPKQPSVIYNLGAPVIIGPMNGGMNYPPAFKTYESSFSKIVLKSVRFLSSLINLLLPGKRKAALLLVANERTRKSLPKTASYNVQTLVENGVDLSLWETNLYVEGSVQGETPTFLYLGRLISLKAIDILLESLSDVLKERDVKLKIIGDGVEKDNLMMLAKKLNIEYAVDFVGFKPQKECVELIKQSRSLILPSLCECGGAVILEAMAMETAVIATNWGGPQDYITNECGILIDPLGREEMRASLSEAILLLANNEALAKNMGINGRLKVEKEFSWDKKVEEMLDIYKSVLEKSNKNNSFKRI